MSRWVRLGVLGLGLLGLFLWATLSGASDLSVARVRDEVDQAGGWAIAMYIGAFTVGALVYAPGVIFVIAAAALWGRWPGFFVACAGALPAMSAPFLVARFVGGAPPLGHVKRPGIKAIVDRLAQRPILAIAVLRLAFWFSPALNYGMALAPISFRHYLAGSMLGIVPAIFGIQAVWALLAT